MLLRIAVLSILLINSNAAKPNIVLFMADDLGMGDVGCFGNDTIRTPNIDRIAKEGIKFQHSIAAASVCTPSRAAFLTGRYPIRMGMVPTNIVRVNMFLSSTSGIPENEITLGEIAQLKGYTTALIGKWHLGMHCKDSEDYCHHPNKQGFDYFYGVPLTNLKDFGKEKETVMESRHEGIDNQVATFAVAGIICVLALFKAKLMGRLGATFVIILIAAPALIFLLISKNLAILNGIVMKNKEVVEQPIELEGFAKRLTAEGIQFLQHRKDDQKPFLLVMPWVQVHTAMHASSEFQGTSAHGPYGDNVEELDHCVGRILDTMDELGFTNNTFVYFTSDNGGHVEEIGKHGNREGGHNGIFRGGKAQGGMEGGIRVPTVARWPGKISAGSVMERPVSLMDVFPTVTAMLDAPVPKDRIIDGVNLLPFLQEKDDKNMVPHQYLFHHCGTDVHAARYTPDDGSGNVWKVHFATPNWEEGTEGCGFICDCYGSAVTWHNPPLLYNIGKDPSETTLLNAKEHKQIIDQMRSAVKKHTKSIEPVEDQYAVLKLLPRPWLQPCCDFPNCRCKEQQNQED